MSASESAFPSLHAKTCKADYGYVLFILLAGIITWIGVGLIMTMRQSVYEMTLLVILFDSLSNFWQISYLYSFIVVVALTLLLAVARNWEPKRSLAIVGYYGLSPLIFWVMIRVYNRIFYNEMLSGEAVRLFGSSLIVFYILGLLGAVGFLLAKRRDVLEAFFMLPLIGTVLMLGYIGYSLFTSPDYIYRNAFAFKVEQVDVQGDVVSVKGRLFVNKEGNYIYSASYVNPSMLRPDAQDDVEVAWESANPKGVGEHPVKITAKNVDMTESRYSVHNPGNGLYFQISLAPQDNNPAQSLRSIPIPLNSKTASRTVAPLSPEQN